jgi:hypothetical protein
MFYFFKRVKRGLGRTDNNLYTSNPKGLRSNGIYVFQYKGPTKLGAGHCEFTQILVFIDQDSVFMGEFNQVVQIDEARIEELVLKVRTLKGIDNKQIGSYSRDRNLIRMIFTSGNGTSYYLVGALMDYGMLVNVDVECVNWEKGRPEKIKCFENVRYIFKPM